MLRTVKNKLIKHLGGYTKEEMNYVKSLFENTSTGSTKSMARILNEHTWRTLRKLDSIMRDNYLTNKDKAWGVLYNIIYNNEMLAMTAINAAKEYVYNVNTTLTGTKEIDMNSIIETPDDKLEIFLQSIPDFD